MQINGSMTGSVLGKYSMEITVDKAVLVLNSTLGMDTKVTLPHGTKLEEAKNMVETNKHNSSRYDMRNI